MITYAKDETTREVPVMKYIKQNDAFMHPRTGAWGRTLDLSIGNQAIATVRVIEVSVVSRQKIQKANEVVPVKLKGKGRRRLHPGQRLKGKQRRIQLRGLQRRSYSSRLYRHQRELKYGLLLLSLRNYLKRVAVQSSTSFFKEDII